MTQLEYIKTPKRSSFSREDTLNNTLSRQERKKTIVLVEPNRLIRESIACLLEKKLGLSVVSHVETAVEAIKAIKKYDPDYFVLEIELPGVSGIELIHELRRNELLLPAIVLTHINNSGTCEKALESGAAGYLLKTDGISDFAECLKAIKKGQTHVSESISNGILGCQLFNTPVELARTPRVSGRTKEVASNSVHGDPIAPLSPREREVFHLLAEGLKNSQIAKKLFISPRTVETHRAKVVRKLNMRTNGEIIRYAIKHGLSLP